MIYGFSERNGEIGGYSVKNPLDGLHEWRVFAETEAQAARMIVNGGALEAQVTGQLGGWRYIGSVSLPKGEHVIDVVCGVPVKRVIIANIPLAGEEELNMAWGNRADQTRFQQERVQYTVKELRLLRRHGFIMHQPKDSQSMAAPSGMPMGGIGAGKVEITKNGQITAFTGNNNQDCPIYRMPGSYFAVGVKGKDIGYARALQTEIIGQEMLPAGSVEMDADFPVARYRYNVNPLPLDIELTAWSSHVPGNAEESSLPAAWFDFTVRNRANTPMEAALCFSWESLINVGGSMRRESNSERVLPLCYHTWNASYVWSDRRKNRAGAEKSAVRFWAEEDLGNAASFGEHMIWCSDENAVVIPDRNIDEDELEFARSLADCFGKPFAPTEEGEFRAGAVASVKKLEPGEEMQVRFILAWYMPHMPVGQGMQDVREAHTPTAAGDAGVNYINRFKDVREVLAYAISEGDRLKAESLRLTELMKASDLPEWFKKRLLNDRFVSATGTWFDKKGNFSVNEGPTGMSGCLGTIDQRAASQGFWLTFFPELDENELESFRLCQGEDGQTSHDIGFSEIEYRTTRHTQWPDLAAAYVQQVCRHWQRTGDDEFARRHYPYVKKTIQWAVSMDDCDCGIPYIRKGRGTTYDNQHWEGVNSFIASVHMAMLYLAADMARRMGDADWETYLAMAERAKESRLKMLWDDKRRVFRNAYVNKTGEVDESTFIASLAGDWYLMSAGMKSPVDEEMLRDAAEGILRDCYCETGLTDQGGRPDTPAFMQYPAAYYCAPAMLLGKAEEAMRAMEINDQVILKAPSNHFIQGLTYHMDGGPRWALPYYMTSPATWNLLDAIAGLTPDLRDNTLAVSPKMKGRIPVFTQDAWFMLEADEESVKFTPFRSVKPHAYAAVILDGVKHEIEGGFDPGAAALKLRR